MELDQVARLSPWLLCNMENVELISSFVALQMGGTPCVFRVWMYSVAF